MSNPRYELRAYETTDCCRVARLLAELAAEGVAPASRDALAERWAAAYPRHAEGTGSKAIRARLRHALTILATAGVVDRSDEGDVTIADPDRLAMVSRNLDVVQDSAGNSIPPAGWQRRPEAPEHLRAVQEGLLSRA